MQNSPKLEDRIGRGTFRRTLGALALAGTLALPGCASVQTTANTNGNIPKLDGVWTIRGNSNRVQIEQKGDTYDGKLIDGLGGVFAQGYKWMSGEVKPDGTISCNVHYPTQIINHESKLIGNSEFECKSRGLPFKVRRSLEQGLNSGLYKCGLRVASVDPSSSAEKAGVNVGDVIIGVNGKKLDYEKAPKDPSMSLWQEATLHLTEYELITKTGNYRITKEEGKGTGLRWNFELCNR